jgi:hypothetical protein
LVGHRLWGLLGAIGSVLAWNGLYQAARWLRGQSLSALLTLGLIELILRAAVALILRSAQVFFIVPVIVTAVTGVLFVGSGLRSKPLVARLIAELVPASVLDLRDRRVTHVLSKVSVVYGAEQLVVAGLSLVLVLNLSTSAYVAIHPMVSWLVLGAAIAATAPFLRADLQAVIRCEQPGSAPPRPSQSLNSVTSRRPSTAVLPSSHRRV